MRGPLRIAFLALLLISSADLKGDPARMEISHLGQIISFDATDQANGLWILQGSNNLNSWDSLKRVQVRNTTLSFEVSDIAEEDEGYRYFRLESATEAPGLTISDMLDLPESNYPYAQANTAPSVYGRVFSRASIDNASATLGRVLFYDKRLSANNIVSCASCHKQEHAFADSSRFSIGHKGVPTVRNTPSLLHLRTYSGKSGIFMDGRSPDLEVAVGVPILHADEMGSTEEGFLDKIRAQPYYQSLFQAAYGPDSIAFPQVRLALENFILSMPSFSSKYDEARIAGNFDDFSETELVGKQLYESHCRSCHSRDNFTSSQFNSNGLDSNPVDPGRQAVTGLNADHGKFRVPSLRDISHTAPYMHDGRFATLREVLDFYNSGVDPHENLSLPLDGSPLGLSESDLTAMEEFLGTLTDFSSLTNPAFSDPFRSDLLVEP